MSVKLIYATTTNNTKKLAEYLGSKIGVKAENVKDNPVITSADVLIIGTGVYAGGTSGDIDTYVKTLKDGSVKKAVLFINSCGGKDESAGLKALLQEKGIEVYQKVFTCKAKFLLFNRKHPNQEDCDALVTFMKGALQEIKK